MLRVVASHPGIAGQDHGLLGGLLDDDHTQYARLLGRNPAQTFYGGTLAVHALTLRGNLPQLGGLVRVDSRLGVNASPAGNLRLEVTDDSALSAFGVLARFNTSPFLTASIPTYTAFNVLGVLSLLGFDLTNLSGLLFQPNIQGAGTETLTTWQAAEYALGVLTGGPNVTTARANLLRGSNLSLLASLGTIYGLHVQDFSAALGEVSYGVAIDDFLNSLGVPNLFEAGPGTPYARLIGGANPGVEQTNLYLKENVTLRRVQWKNPGALGVNLLATDRVMVLV